MNREELNAEPVTSAEWSHTLVTGIIRDFVKTGASTANTGGDRDDFEKGIQKGIYQMEHLYLAEPWLVATDILSALELAGWKAPE